MGRLDGKVALITGGNSRIGEATVRLFVKEETKVLLFARNVERSNRIVDDLGDCVYFFKGDVTVEDDVKDAVDMSVEKWGKLDCIFNNAGSGSSGGSINSISEISIDAATDVMIKGVIFRVKHASWVMKPQGYGTIINCSSISGLVVVHDPLLYSTCKAAVIHMTRMAATELGEYGIRVNDVCPGAILTPIWYKGEMSDEFKKGLTDIFVKHQSLKRVGMPKDVANAVLWLASEESSFITRHSLVIDGGSSIGWPRTTIQNISKEMREVYRKERTK